MTQRKGDTALTTGEKSYQPELEVWQSSARNSRMHVGRGKRRPLSAACRRTLARDCHRANADDLEADRSLLCRACSKVLSDEALGPTGNSSCDRRFS